MPPRSSSSILAARARVFAARQPNAHSPSLSQSIPPFPSRFQSSSSSSSSSAETRPTPSSNPSRLPPHAHSSGQATVRPTFSRTKLAAFTAGGELLTSPSRAPPTLRPSTTANPNTNPNSNHSPSAREPVKRNSSLPKPVLKSNPYAGSYAISEADLGDGFAPPSTTPASSSSQSQGTDQQSQSPSQSQPQKSPHIRVRSPRRTPSQAKYGVKRTSLYPAAKTTRAAANPDGVSADNDSPSGINDEIDGSSALNRRLGRRKSIVKPRGAFVPNTNTQPRFGTTERDVGQSGQGAQEASRSRSYTLDITEKDSVTLHDGYVTFTSRDTGVNDAVITLARLRDACRCRRCRDPSTKQMISTTGQATMVTRPVIRKHLIGGAPGMEIYWNARNTSGAGTEQEPDRVTGLEAHQAESNHHYQWVSIKQLRLMTNPYSWDHLYRSSAFARKTWDKESIDKMENLRIPYSAIAPSQQHDSSASVSVNTTETDTAPISLSAPNEMLKVLQQLQVYGLVVITGVPTNPTDNDDCMLRKVANQIGEIRNTFYGETWDVKSVKQSKNVAYTDLDLGLHMDLLYFSSPPRFQALHCLRNRVNGGQSYFVDAFKVVLDLPVTTFRNLRDNKIPYIYDNDDHFLRYRHPVISHDFALSNPHAAVNWSPPFRATGDPISLPPSFSNSNSNPNHPSASHGQAQTQAALESRTEWIVKKETDFYNSIADFENRLNDDKYRYSYTLREGDLVLFDNRRVLHARTSFADKSDQERTEQGIELVEGEPTRWLKGCYLDGEVIWDKLATLKRRADTEGQAEKRNEAKAISASSEEHVENEV